MYPQFEQLNGLIVLCLLITGMQILADFKLFICYILFFDLHEHVLGML